MDPELEALRASLAQLEERVRRLEGGRPEVAAAAPAPPVAHGDGNAASLIGRSLIAVGGAYLLRAGTDLGWWPAWLGALAALVYAGVLLALADRAAARGASTSALFHAGTAAAIANPLIDELFLRLHLVGAWSAAGIAGGFAAANAWVAWRRRQPGLAWVGVLAGTALYAALALQSQALVAACAGLALLAVVAGVLVRRLDQRGLLAPPLVAGSLIAPWLAETAPAADPGALPVLLAFFLAGAGAIWWSAATTHVEMVEAGLLAAAVLVESLRLAAGHAWFGLALGGAAAAGYLYARARASPFFARYWLLVAMAALWGISGGTALTLLYLAVVAAITVSRGDDFQVLAPLTAAVASSGLAGFTLGALALPSPGPPPWTALLVLAASVAVAAARPRVPALALAALGLAALLAWAGIVVLAPAAGGAAAIRTCALAATVMALALLSRLPRAAAAAKLVVPLLVLIGAKLLLEDFRVGSSSALFVDLAMLGAVVILAPRLRRRAHEGQS